MGRHVPARSWLAALLLAGAAVVHAQAQEPRTALSIAFANDLGDGPYRAALLRGLRSQLDGRLDLRDGAAAHGATRRFTGVVRVRSLRERRDAAGQSTLEARVSLSLVDAATGTSRLTRLIRTEYPVAGASPVEALGEASGRKLAAAICSVACIDPLPPAQPRAGTPRRIIKESDW